jgi:phosphatidylglycerol:prolipoprotein diacylglycerol transferase
MAFHGVLLGVIIAIIVFARRRRIATLALGDIVASVVPIGLCLGRLANFVNGELFGRVSDVPWAVIFPNGGPEPRHPSQLYEAGLEGLVLGLVLFAAWRLTNLRLRPGAITGLFLVGYGLARFTVELFRQPDANLGFLFAGATMGQLLSLPMILVGIALMIWARPFKAPAEPVKPAPQVRPAKKKR